MEALNPLCSSKRFFKNWAQLWQATSPHHHKVPFSRLSLLLETHRIWSRRALQTANRLSWWWWWSMCITLLSDSIDYCKQYFLSTHHAMYLSSLVLFYGALSKNSSDYIFFSLAAVVWCCYFHSRAHQKMPHRAKCECKSIKQSLILSIDEFI